MAGLRVFVHFKKLTLASGFPLVGPTVFQAQAKVWLTSSRPVSSLGIGPSKTMGKGGKGKGGGYPWWEHLNKGGGKGSSQDKDDGGGHSAGGAGGGGGSSGLKRTRGSKSELEHQLEKMEGKPYNVYKDLSGAQAWDVNGSRSPALTIGVYFDRVQGDAYAPPSWIRARVSMKDAGFPAEYVTSSRVKNSALCDYVTRVLSDRLHGGAGTDWTKAVSGGGWSSSKGGDLQIDTPGQYVLERTSVVAKAEFIEARVTLALPARGRSIEGYRAAEIVGGLVEAVEGALVYSALDADALRKHIESVEDQDNLRQQLTKLGLVGFVANGSVLPRKSGVDDRPMTAKDVPELVTFRSPQELEMEVKLPHAGKVKGMGVKKGITVIVGGGFHGKSTLLQALQLGIYNKVPGDGREFVVCDPDAVKVRAEDGRSVKCTDISAFINNLPFGKGTTSFSTGDASGSTSQAANISEALEMEATTLLIDEDTCATNFMIRDNKMQALVAPDKEPITPFTRKIRPLFEEHGISTVLVVGGSGDFFMVADTVVMMEEYKAIDVTGRAKQIAEEFAAKTQPPRIPFGPLTKRHVQKTGLAADGKVAARNLRCIQYGETEVELSCVEQLVETSQARAIGDCLQKLGDGDHLGGANKSLLAVLRDLEKEIKAEGQPVGVQGLDKLSRFREPCPFYVMPRRLEIAAAVNRLRTANVVAMGQSGGGDAWS
eukprot:gnl/TRDRNA2_/TRDRNA2_131143_c0_seq1.p1 gnl/TRDRNA2_/TRDRNA2_131143_c0~~gnl/TRDRNA2_/TRDRNA2_131143_c0_seq1.p1  ORF type:complete len:712 (+),score=154.11 gnl/TRDRNA2_/TRDRNA2_131143_c0_seq1:2-2137(+)